MFLAGPYDSAHERCASYLRTLPGFRKIYENRDIEIYQHY
jgi:hypothetical protein